MELATRVMKNLSEIWDSDAAQRYTAAGSQHHWSPKDLVFKDTGIQTESKEESQVPKSLGINETRYQAWQKPVTGTEDTGQGRTSRIQNLVLCL